MKTLNSRRCWLLVALTAVTLSLLTAVIADEKAPKPDFTRLTPVKVLRVIDGDTIEVEQDGKATKVRLVAVDTPETVHPSKPVERFGKEASEFTRKALQGEKVYLVFDSNGAATKHRDRYGRLLAYVLRERDKLDVCAELVRQGYAHAYLKYPSERGEEFLGYQREAREKKRGLWADEAVATEKKDPAGTDAKVYVTTTGTKYHRAGCRYLSKSMRELTLAEAKKGYEPCSVCNPPAPKE